MKIPVLIAAMAGLLAAEGPPRFSVLETGIPDMQQALRKKRITSYELVRLYLERIALHEDSLNATLYVNPKALEEATRLDRERAQGKVRGPLHGIPIALKDNIHTVDMPTTGGALAFAGFVPPYDATLTKSLRDAGAIIIAKTGLTELANWVAGSPTLMPGTYTGLGGFGFNPYDVRHDPRADADGRPVLTAGGSSSGIGTAASFWAANVGTETSGSILGPANQCMLAAIKPTVGRVSRHGVVPITADQDTPGPMARTVTDAAILLGALEGAHADSNDAATSRCQPPPGRDYTRFLKKDGLKGARIGIPRVFFYDKLSTGRGGLAEAEAKLMAEAIVILKAQGAVIVDPADIPSLPELMRWGICAGADAARGKDENCSIVFKYGMKRDFNAWLTSLGAAAPVKTLTELREWNLAHAKAGAIRYGQSRLDISDEVNLEADRARYEADRAKDIRLAGTEGIDAVMKQHRLDAILFPASNGYDIAAKPGYPTVIVPFGMVPNAPRQPFPAGFEAKPMPFGVSFAGIACSEPKLVELGYAFEQATRRRVAPLP
jgi:amidase